jgi:hypothetical protein
MSSQNLTFSINATCSACKKTATATQEPTISSQTGNIGLELPKGWYLVATHTDTTRVKLACSSGCAMSLLHELPLAHVFEAAEKKLSEGLDARRALQQLPRPSGKAPPLESAARPSLAQVTVRIVGPFAGGQSLRSLGLNFADGRGEDVPSAPSA